MMAFSTYPKERQKTSHNNRQFPYMKYNNVRKAFQKFICGIYKPNY